MTHPTTLKLLVLVVLTTCTALDAPAQATYDPPYPSAEQRERLRKGHVVLGSRYAPASPQEEALLTAQDDVDITRYFLDVAFSPAGRSVTGSVTITATSLAPGFQHLVLDLLANMSVTSVTRNGTNLTFSRPGNLVDVTLDQPFGPGQSFEVKVSYSGVPQSVGFGSIGWNKYLFTGAGQMVWTLSEPEGARSWWPCKDRPDDKAGVEMWWTVPDTWIATGNGVLIGTVNKSGNRKQYKWKPTHPLTTYLVMVAATNYATFSHTYTTLTGGTMPVVYYVYPEDLVDAQESFSPTVSMITHFAQTFGEYPFVEDKYGMSAFPWSGAMEHSTNTSYGYTLITGGHDYDYIIAHELAHQWWGDTVSPHDWQETWLNEGFATHSEALWAEHLNGPQGYRDYMNGLWRESFSGPVYGNADGFGTTVYDKGAWVQHMLRGVVGDSAFFGALRDWYAEHKDGVGSTVEWRSTLQLRHGAPLDWFFDEWVYGTGSPRYEYGWSTADLGNGTFRTYVRIHQVQSGTGTFIMPVQLALSGVSGGDVRTVWNDLADQDFVLDTAEAPTGVLLDDLDWILKASVVEVILPDADADGVPDRNDNCTAVGNGSQNDFDLDGAGDACDLDDDADLLDDTDDCAPLDATQGEPDEVAALSADRGEDGSTLLSWSAARRADAYDLVRGPIDGLATGSYGACLESSLPALTYQDPEVPAPDAAWLYLVRGHDGGCGGGGSLGEDSSGAPRPSPCP